jgi:murein DD-endopeptidase MepM/ murein hydrolase activator NlpD
VVAVRGGVVLTAAEGFGGGVVVIEHWSGLDSWYGHVGKILVNKGSRVKQGQIIARLGNRPVLHFKIFVNDRPVDPLKYLR